MGGHLHTPEMVNGPLMAVAHPHIQELVKAKDSLVSSEVEKGQFECDQDMEQIEMVLDNMLLVGEDPHHASAAR